MRLFLKIAALLLVGAAVVGVWYAFSHQSNQAAVMESKVPDDTVPQQPRSEPVVRNVPAGSKEYHSFPYFFSLYYPKDLAIRETDSADGHTVAFEELTNGYGFQIYITPYTGETISQEQFLEDEPSGVIRERQTVLIDGVQAEMFFGQNPLMGDTREVWFIRNGYLYEVMTYKQLDTWLASIMQTWKFLQ